ncbi:MAG: sporulation membrane protein YtaF [Syntrophomonadaceae bacterium]|nr:sporulation membrane protein YtaF [Syntrophomonadaceae bacterium]
MELISSILFGLAVSADGFAAGMAYGVKKIKIPIFSLLVIALASALAVSISMFCGRGLAMGLSPELASRLGALTILVLGSYFVLQALGEKISTIDTEAEQPIISVSIKPLGIIVQILKEPARADFDCSGIISAREAFFLGLALALDAMGAGVGVAMAGLNIFYTVLAVGVLKFILVNLGLLVGAFFNQAWIKSLSAVISGLILIIIGISEFI